jgi:hypothetical protein
MAHAQAGITDNTPVYVLGGNIIPIGVNGTNTTTGARAGLSLCFPFLLPVQLLCCAVELNLQGLLPGQAI